MTPNAPILAYVDAAGHHGQFEEAMKYHRDGNRTGAGKIYREILRDSPSHTGAMRNLRLSPESFTYIIVV